MPKVNDEVYKQRLFVKLFCMQFLIKNCNMQKITSFYRIIDILG